MKWRTSRQDEAVVGVAVVGCGHFVLGFLAQAQRLPWLRVHAIADIDIEGTKRKLIERLGWDSDFISARSVKEAREKGKIFITENSSDAISPPGIDIVLEGTGDVCAAVRTALVAFWAKRSIIMATLEADTLLGFMLARCARKSAVLYSLAYGDSTALTSEMTNWAELCGFSVVCAGKSQAFRPDWCHTNDEQTWERLGVKQEEVKREGYNLRIFTAMADGTKLAHDLASIANACDLEAPEQGLRYPYCTQSDLAKLLRPRQDGGSLERSGVVECVSTLCDDENARETLHDSCFIIIRAHDKSVAERFHDHRIKHTSFGEYTAIYRPVQLLGLETPVTIASIAWRREATGWPAAFNCDVVAVAKRDLSAGEVLTGAGGNDVYGRLESAKNSLRQALLPVSLTTGARLLCPVACDQAIGWADVEIDMSEPAVGLRKTMEAACRPLLLEGKPFVDFNLLDQID